jgi:DNA-binding SARP family transcriptional activator
VVEALVSRFREHAVVQVVASAGSGKTTAVAQACESVDLPVAWLTLEEWHRAPGRFANDLLDALQQIAPGIQQALAGGATQSTTPAERAAAAGAFLRRHRAILVLDNCHLVAEAPETVAVVSTLARRSSPGLHLVLVGRSPLLLRGLDVSALAPDAQVGDELLRSTLDEASEILRSHDRLDDLDEAFHATDGWIAGLVFETWRTEGGGRAGSDPLRAYLEGEVLPRLTPDAAEALVATSMFDEVDVRRAADIGVDDPMSWFAALRRAGLPAVWLHGGSSMRLHPRIREVLVANLHAGPVARRSAALHTAGVAFEGEDLYERALECYVEAGAQDEARRLLADVIMTIVERRDVALARRFLDVIPFEREPSNIVLARLVLANFTGSHAERAAILGPLRESGRLDDLIAEEPRIGAITCFSLVTVGELEEAENVLAGIPPGRTHDVARLMLSTYVDDPAAPIPPFTGDILDTDVARGLYGRGRLRELREGLSPWALLSGARLLARTGDDDELEGLVSRPIWLIGAFARAVEMRDREAASRCVDELTTGWGGPYSALLEAELAVRFDRDAARALRAIERLRGLPTATLAHVRELGAVWEGAALLLSDENHAAAEVLREAVASMRRGDRTLGLPTCLVFLAEAEWRLGEEEASDRATEAAYEASTQHGTLRDLMLALDDFPGVLSRRLDAESGVESPWHSLGRALSSAPRESRSLTIGPPQAHLREFGVPTLVVRGSAVRPKIRKSLELLSYLVAAHGARVPRDQALIALWNGRTDDSSRAYFRQALRHLRDVLPDGVSVETVGEMLVLRGRVTAESLELDALVAEAARNPVPDRLGYLLDAMAVGERGVFLAGSDDVDWVEDRRAVLAGMLTDARIDAAELMLDAERYPQALTLVDAALDANPLLERAWRVRMRAFGLLGDYDGVLAAFGDCRRALAEIGLEPSAATAELAERLRR